MPQITLRLSRNIDLRALELPQAFAAIHEAFKIVPDINIKSCFSGVIFEDYSYIGLGEERHTKLYLEVLWLEHHHILKQKKELAQQLMHILETKLVPHVEKQGLICVPRLRIASLGSLDHEYYVSARESR